MRKRYEKVRYYVWRVWDPFLDFFWLARRGKSEARRHLAWLGWDQYVKLGEATDDVMASYEQVKRTGGAYIAELERRVVAQAAVIATQREHAAAMEEELEELRDMLDEDGPVYGSG